MTTLHTEKRGERTQPSYMSAYRMMWMLVTFDLPVDTKRHRAEATKFRQFLLDQGFEMSQLSNYLRLVNGQEQFETYTRRIGSHLPERGDVLSFNLRIGNMKISSDSAIKAAAPERKILNRLLFSNGHGPFHGVIKPQNRCRNRGLGQYRA